MKRIRPLLLRVGVAVLILVTACTSPSSREMEADPFLLAREWDSMSEDDRIGFAVSEMAFFCDASRTNSGPFKKSLRRRADFWRDYLSEHADSRVDFVDIYNRACGLSQS